MAIYTYRCPRCGKDEEVFQLISEYCVTPRVPYCNCSEDGVDRAMERYLTPILMVGDMQPFISPIDGSIISGRASRREHMLKHGVVPTDEIMGDVARNRKRMLEGFKEKTKENIREAISMCEQGYKPRPDAMKDATTVGTPDG